MIVLVGVNHKTAPVAFRERLAVAEDQLPDRLAELGAVPGVAESMVLSTCNRVELLVRATDPTGPVTALKQQLARRAGLSVEELDGQVYVHTGTDAVRHVLHVAAGIDSMILGEPQILGQVKRAYAIARETGSTGPILDRLLQQALAAAKKVRSDTGISRHAVSLAYAAVELARKVFGELKDRRVLIIGAGKMCELAARHMVRQGARLEVATRSYERASAFAARTGGQAIPWKDWPVELGGADAAICGTAAPGTILDRSAVLSAMRARRSRPLFLIDLAVPRDIDPSVDKLENVYLYDIDDLQDVVEQNRDERRRAAAEARQIIEEVVQRFEGWRRSLSVKPTLLELRETFHELGAEELKRFRGRLGPMSESQGEVVEQLTRSIVRKMLHGPTRFLKQLAEQEEAGRYVALYREIFDLGPEGEDPADDEPTEATVERSRRRG